MKSRTFLLLLTLGLTVTMSCASMAQKSRRKSGKQPVWITHPADYQKASEYLVAFGTGSSFQDARNNALGNLSRIFQSEVKTDQTLIDEFHETIKGDRLNSDRTSQLLSVTRVGSSQNLINAKVLESYTARDETFYVLMGMQRQETAHIYSSEIANNELHINELEHQADQENNVLDKLGYLKKALVLQEVNDNLQKQRSVLTGQSLSGLRSEDHSLIRTYGEVKKRCLIYLNTNGIPGEIVSVMDKVLQDEGFTVTRNSTDAILHAIVSYQWRQMDMNRKDAQFVKWDFHVRFDNPAGDRSFRTFNIEGRDGALTYREAVLRCDETVKKKLTTEFRKFLRNELLHIN